MLDFITAAPLWVFIISLLGAILTWFAADQFRDQILADSHRLVREVALRYLQIIIGLFAIFLVGVILSLWAFASNAIAGVSAPEEPTATVTFTPTATFDPFLNPPTATDQAADGTGEAIATVASPASDDSLIGIRTARVVNTGGAGVNMRDLPTLSGEIVAIVAEGDVVSITGDSLVADGITWHPCVTRTGAEGWIAEQFLLFESDLP